MNLILRRAKTGDEIGLRAVKEDLPMPRNAQNATTRGGFLLGTTLENYHFLIENAFADVLEDDRKIVGFAIVLPDVLLRNSEMWRRKDEIEWRDFDSEEFADAPICYFEQLAILPAAKYRFYGIALAFLTLEKAFAAGHAAMFTTTVQRPIRNSAAVPFLNAIGAKIVGQVDETIDGFGNLVSDVYFVERETFAQNSAAHRLYGKVRRFLASSNQIR